MDKFRIAPEATKPVELPTVPEEMTFDDAVNYIIDLHKAATECNKKLEMLDKVREEMVKEK